MSVPCDVVACTRIGGEIAIPVFPLLGCCVSVMSSTLTVTGPSGLSPLGSPPAPASPASRRHHA